MSGGVQIPLGDLPLDPRQLATLSIDLHPIQRQAAEDAVRLIVAGRYGGAS